MRFWDALEAAVTHGMRIERAGWNGKGMHVELRDASDVGDAWHPTPAHLVMWTVDRTYVPWVASQADLLADDWAVTVPVTGRFEEKPQEPVCGPNSGPVAPRGWGGVRGD